jgi:hypothetical protein
MRRSFWCTGRLIALRRHGPELQELFPSPEQSREEIFVQELKAALTPICVESITELEAFTSTNYYSHHTQMSGGMTVKRFYCR